MNDTVDRMVVALRTSVFASMLNPKPNNLSTILRRPFFAAISNAVGPSCLIKK